MQINISLIISACDPGYFGAKCLNVCSPHCYSNDTCHNVDGVCPNQQCKSGFMGPLCDIGMELNPFFLRNIGWCGMYLQYTFGLSNTVWLKFHVTFYREFYHIGHGFLKSSLI